MELIEKHSSNNEFTWIDITKPTLEGLKEVSARFNLNHHNLNDSLEPDHLPKFEEGDEFNFIILRKVLLNSPKTYSIQSLSTKIAIFFNDKVVLTIHRLPAPELNSIGEQFIESGRINSAHFLILKIVSRVQLTYTEHAAVLNKQIEEFETKLFLKTSSKISIETLYVLKRKVGISKKILLLTEEVITSLLHRHKKSNEMQDIRDNHKKLILFYDQLNEDAQNLLSTYMSYNGQKTNEVMKVLTLFSAYFLPLTFIVGLYGMNFKYMPELSWKYGYPITIGLMLLVFIFIYLWFRKRKWL